MINFRLTTTANAADAVACIETAAHFHAIASATVYSCGAMVLKASTRTSMSEAGLRAPVFSEAVRS